ncbi:uncharacterized protein LOC109281027 [Alligator mississippiensis]|uniref:Uncharacterized protein n=1 Tax=Alligator mississippiensis TaxID=8496 RepID=A0A151M5I3_ALLMI|nr:uncharacterized protein LOC109281027 [Alligator mississippiensis]KYO19680.1 hypothetical protein Y1Q_0012338 [Alligator mississippiensis]
MAAEDKSLDAWPLGLGLKSPPYTLPLGLEAPAPSSRKLAILTAGAVLALAISLVGVLVGTYLGRAACSQGVADGSLPAQVHVQNEAALLLALSELGERGAAPGITCDLRNHLMLYHGQPEGCVGQKMDPLEQLPPCRELESYFQTVLSNATLGLGLEMGMDVQSVGAGALGSLAVLLCSNKPTYLVAASPPSPRYHGHSVA